ncbi:hypothetical protein ACGF0J_20860 [Nonomuraea sp. NPDC047897]|uniref:hypothetical protein n=1 Tax=Nonomuraea sp. NPDC047897 TaxID=3364346 RepID=UPI0037229F59
MESIRIRRRGLGRPRKRPARAMGDKAYSSRGNRAYLHRHGIQARKPAAPRLEVGLAAASRWLTTAAGSRTARCATLPTNPITGTGK